jgi:excisionase family DNA binding protein
MPQTKPKPRKPTPPVIAPENEVFTLGEAAAYLRVPEAQVIRLVQQQELPGRLLGQEWRFLKTALQDWLRTPPPRGSKEAFLSLAGSWKDDPYVEEELKEIYKRRGRPMTEDGE